MVTPTLGRSSSLDRWNQYYTSTHTVAECLCGVLNCLSFNANEFMCRHVVLASSLEFQYCLSPEQPTCPADPDEVTDIESVGSRADWIPRYTPFGCPQRGIRLSYSPHVSSPAAKQKVASKHNVCVWESWSNLLYRSVSLIARELRDDAATRPMLAKRDRGLYREWKYETLYNRDLIRPAFSPSEQQVFKHLFMYLGSMKSWADSEATVDQIADKRGMGKRGAAAVCMVVGDDETSRFMYHFIRTPPLKLMGSGYTLVTGMFHV